MARDAIPLDVVAQAGNVMADKLEELGYGDVSWTLVFAMEMESRRGHTYRCGANVPPAAASHILAMGAQKVVEEAPEVVIPRGQGKPS